MTHEDWNAALAPKVEGTWNLHQALDAEKLDFFVLFSSIVGLTGHIGQANYTAANAFLDAFVKYRHGKGLPASVIDLGFMQSIGSVAQNPKLLEVLRPSFLYGVEEKELLDALQMAISKQGPGSSTTCQFSIGMNHTKPLCDVRSLSRFSTDARFGLYVNLESSTLKDSKPKDESVKGLISSLETNPATLDEALFQSMIARAFDEMTGNLMFQGDDVDEDLVLNMVIESLMSIENGI